jgi:hypothetical protein
MKCFYYPLLAVVVAGCDVDPTHVFFESPTDANLVGNWSGIEEITTAEDNSPNVGSPADRGFSFPVVINLTSDGRFTLITAGYPTSFDNQSDRSCSGVYTRRANTVTFFPRESCRALPMTRYTVGRVLPSGITLNANTNSVGNPAPYLTMRVFMRLERD